MERPEEFFHYHDGHLIYTGVDGRLPPISIAEVFGPDLRTLDLSFANLNTDSYTWLCNLPSLDTIILDNCGINDSFKLPAVSNKLTTLSLNKNHLTDLDRLLKMLRLQAPNLVHLSLLGNPASPAFGDMERMQRYRSQVCQSLQHLSFLDSSPITSSDRKNQKLPDPPRLIIHYIDSGDGSKVKEYSAMKRRFYKRKEGSVIGKMRYSYTGKNSEGNRFIRNADL